MGLFNTFRKKVEDKTDALNPFYTKLNEAGFGIKNMQLTNEGGSITVSGSMDDGAKRDEVSQFLSGLPKVADVSNDIVVEDVSGQGKKCKVVTRGSNLNVRSGGSTKDGVVGRFANDAEVLLVRRYNASWHQVRGKGITGEQVEGYCHTDFLEAL